MRKLIRPTYPKEFSIGLLLLIFVIACFLSLQIFVVPIHDLNENKDVYVGMLLASFAVIIMVLIMWEEILFPIKLKEIPGGIEFRNHKSKLRVQIMMYCCIPVIFIFIYLNFEIKFFRFLFWAIVCMVPPVLEKIVSGINNLQDFLQLTVEKIHYKNNEKEGDFKTSDIIQISILSEDKSLINKIELFFKDGSSVIIDIDEMELEAFYVFIYKFIVTNYKHLLKE